jgi:hypothetical protein
VIGIGRIRNLIRKHVTRARLRQLGRHRAHLEAGRRRSFLFWVPGGMPLMLDVEGAIAASLGLRGHDVHAVVCDGTAKACIKREVGINPDLGTWAQECGPCRRSCEERLKDFGVPHSAIGEHVSAAERATLRKLADGVTWDELPQLEYAGINVGTNVKSSVLRYFKGDKYNGDPELLREYVYAGLVSLVAARNVCEKTRPTDIVMSHGVYADWGPPLRVALARGMRATCWGGSYLHARFYFRHPSDYREDLDFHRLDKGSWERESKAPLSEREAARLNDYLTNRYVKGASYDIKKSRTYRGATDHIRARYGLREGRKVWGLLTHVNWDAVTDYSPMLFEDFDQWILSTIERLRDDTTVDWLVKVHPGEGWHNPTTGIQALIKRHYPVLPEHIHLIGFDDSINPLDFFNLIDGAVTVYGTSGLEISCLGKPTIVAGLAHYSRKGFTYDPNNVEDYYKLLASVASIGPLSEAQRQLALRYAYIYFIRRQIPFPPVENPDAHREHGFWKFDSRRAGMLLPGGNRYVDFIAQRIIDNGEFVLPEELLDEPLGLEMPGLASPSKEAARL